MTDELVVMALVLGMVLGWLLRGGPRPRGRGRVVEHPTSRGSMIFPEPPTPAPSGRAYVETQSGMVSNTKPEGVTDRD